MLFVHRRLLLVSVFTSLCVINNAAIALNFEPGIGLGLEYTGNARLSADNQVSDVINASYIGARLHENGGDFQYNVAASFVNNAYQDDSFDDEQYFSLGVSASWETIKDRLNWFLKENFHQRAIQELTSNTPDNLQDSNAFTVGADANVPLSSIQSISFTPQYSSYYFEEQSTDNQQLSFAASWKYQFFRLTNVALNVSTRNVDYTEINSLGQSITDTDFTTISVSLDKQFRRSKFMLDLGSTEVKRDSGTAGSGFLGSGFTGSASWLANLTTSSNLKVSFSTELTDTSGVAFSSDSPENSSVDNLEVTSDVVRNSLFHLTYIREDASLNSRYWLESRKVRYSGDLLTRETQAVGLKLSQLITQLLSGAVYLKYNRTKQLETLRKDKRYTAGAHLKYRLTRKINAVFDVKYRKKDSNSPVDNYDETSVFATIVYGFGIVPRPTRSGGF